MNMICRQRGIITMGDVWDYKLRKMEIAWELAERVIPKEVTDRGRWTERDFLKVAQQMLKEAFDAVDATFTEDKGE